MTGSIELDPDGQSLQIRFPYRPDLVDEVKTIPGRRWDRNGKLWRVPATQVSNVVDVFMRHGFAMAPEVTSLLAGTQGETLVELPTVAPEPPDSISIGMLNERVRGILRDNFAAPVWVHGEILDYDKNKDRPNVFFTLVDKLQGSDAVAAQATAVLFKDTARMLRTKLENAPEPLTLTDGIEIRALVRVELYPKNGRYQLILDDIDASFTLGKMALTREQILQELRQKGLDRKNLELPLPRPALRIGVLTSPDSDGWTDFHKQVEASGVGFQITCYAVKVQGPYLQPTMLAGLRWFEQRQDQFDALCILRGGGSRSDLSWFDNRDVALAAARHPLKILCGIGHQRDQSVLDVITHSEKTPTAVGAFLVQQLRSTEDELAQLCQRLVTATRQGLGQSRSRLAEMAQSVRHHVRGRLAFERQRLAGSGRRLAMGVHHRVRSAQDGLVRYGERIRASAGQRLTGAAATLEKQEARQRLLDPRRVLQRGYTLVRNEQGKIITGIAGLERGSAMDVQFRDGRARATVDEIEESKGNA